MTFTIHDDGKRVEYPTGALRSDSSGKGRFDLISPFMLERLAKHYETGGLQKGDRNWELGFNFSSAVSSCLRHINKYRLGMRDEDHLSAAIWQLACMIHFEEMIRLGKMTDSIDDLPKYVET